MALLRALADSPVDLGNNELARRAGINPSTASRMLATLGQDELVRRIPETGRFRLGPGLIELGNVALSRVDLRELARAHLVALTEATGETATLSVPGEHTMVTVDFVQSPLTVRSVAVVGRPSVTHATAIGKVFLASTGILPRGPLTAYTKRTITDAVRLADEVTKTKNRGWGQAVGEREEDLNAVAAPVVGMDGRLMAVLGLQGPRGRFGPEAMQAGVDQLFRHCTGLSRTI